MICILGCLDTDEGKRICDEMEYWLKKEHDVFTVHQNPPGTLFEYPAIKTVIQTAITMDEPVLYLHTKGAGNPIPKDYQHRMMHRTINFPATAKPEDCQKIVRNMWKHEFTGERLKLYLEKVNTSEPIVCCPYTGKEKVTWQNGWVINPSAAKILKNQFTYDKNRYYFETLFSNINEIKVIGIRGNHCDLKEPFHKSMWDDIWRFYELNK